MMDRLVSLGVGVKNSEDFARVFQDLSDLARNLGESHDYVNVAASVIYEDSNEDTPDEDLYYDDNTLRKIHSTMWRCGLSEEATTEIINRLLDVGIVFRERKPS